MNKTKPVHRVLNFRSTNNFEFNLSDEILILIAKAITKITRNILKKSK